MSKKLLTCGKFTHTNLGTVKTGISQVGKNAFSCLKSNENLHPLSVEIETLVLRIGRNRIFWLPKCVKITHTKLGTCRKFAHTELGNFQCGFHETAKRQFHSSKMRKFPHSFRGTNKSQFQATKMRKIC